MFSLVRAFMRGPFIAGIILSSCFALGLLLSPFTLFSNALVSLMVLRNGFSKALSVFSISVALCAVMCFAILGNLAPLLPAVLFWIAAIIVALSLRITRDYSLSLLLSTMLVFVYLVLFRVNVTDLDEFWSEKIMEFVSLFSESDRVKINDDQIRSLSSQVHFFWIVLLSIIIKLGLIIGRYFQAYLYNPNGFGSEFRKIRQPIWLAAVFLGLVIFKVAINTGEPFSITSDMLVLVTVIFAFQGVVFIHRKGKEIDLSKGFFYFFYIILVLFPQLVGFMLAVTGIVDTLGYRKKVISS